MKRAYKIVLVVLSLITVILAIIGIQIYRFHSDVLKNPLVSDAYPENVRSSSEAVNYIIKDKKGCFVSKAYFISFENEKQIRFRYVSKDLLNKADMLTSTAFKLTDNSNIDLNRHITVHSEEFCGFDGITLKFNKDTEVPEKLFLTIGSSAEALTEPDKDKSFSYCETEITTVKTVILES